ncbi:hypothetical protein ASE63_22435 [Bosea sp. Root381]|uniref:hypothetical protein n=1 Tax=Bosea sp. Root381 TaxID=1736524 RepID=UPI0006F4D658|nr:hypothetical protein [Bosea sp. Root381]KRE07460.1 hypothetical protein ASE63_22435 [Bosea sp. Root381]
MLSFIRRLFAKARNETGSALWPYPLTGRGVQMMLFHAVRVARVAAPAREADMVRLLGPNPLEVRSRPSNHEPFMTPDDLGSFNLDRRLKLSAEFFLCLAPEAQKDPQGAERKLVRHSIASISNRRDLNRMVQTMGPRQIVEFIRDSETGCGQSRAFVGKSWAAVAPDLPLPGCTAEICLCGNRAVIDF